MFRFQQWLVSTSPLIECYVVQSQMTTVKIYMWSTTAWWLWHGSRKLLVLYVLLWFQKRYPIRKLRHAFVRIEIHINKFVSQFRILYKSQRKSELLVKNPQKRVCDKTKEMKHTKHNIDKWASGEKKNKSLDLLLRPQLQKKKK